MSEGLILLGFSISSGMFVRYCVLPSLFAYFEWLDNR